MLRRRVSWTDLLPFLGFFLLGLFAVRNLPAAGVVLAPVLGRILRPTNEPRRVTTVAPAFAAALAVLTAVFAVTALAPAPVDTTSYPVAAVTFLQRQGLLDNGHRLAHQDWIGNYLELRYAGRVKVFIDDRVDMYPVAVSNDYRDLSAATGSP